MIRFATYEDISAMLDIYRPYVENTTHSFEYRAPTEKEFRTRFENYTEKLPWLVWEQDGIITGYAYASLPFHRAAYDWCCEVSIYLAPQFHGQGIGRRLYTALEHLVYLQGYQIIYAIITTENQGSLRFHERLGYRTVAVLPDCGVKFGRRLGTVWTEKRFLSDIPPNNPPKPVSAIVENDRKLRQILATLSLS